MTKVVINNCFGGFSLSIKAVILYAKKAGFPLSIISEGMSSSFYKCAPENLPAYFKLSWGERIETIGYGEAIKIAPHFSPRELDRCDPILLEVVNELGAEANGSFAELLIVEIPDEIEWQIEEYDGAEWVAEKHRRWP